MKRAPGRGLCAAAFLGIALLAVFAPAPAAAQDDCTSCLLRPLVTSTPASGSTYLPGETITVQVRPRNSPWVSITSADSPTLVLRVGSSDKTLNGTLQSRQYSYTVYDHEQRQDVTRSRDTNVLEFSYTVLKGDRDTDGVSVAANALGGGFIGANVGGSQFGGGTHRPNISKTHSAMNAQSGHKVDTPAPTFSGVTGPDIIFYAGAYVNYRLPAVANADAVHNLTYSVTSARPAAEPAAEPAGGLFAERDHGDDHGVVDQRVVAEQLHAAGDRRVRPHGRSDVPPAGEHRRGESRRSRSRRTPGRTTPTARSRRSGRTTPSP